MKQLVTLLIFLIASTLSFSQNVIKPFKIDKKYLSGLDIPRLQLPSDPERKYYQKRLYKGSELSVFILASETFENKINNFPIDEFVFYINGRADIKTRETTVIHFYADDYLFVPKGFSGSWKNNGGEKLHLELSVISNKRADSTKKSTTKQPFLLNREFMSGVDFVKSNAVKNHKTLYSGVELEVVIEAELPTKKEIHRTSKEEFIHILMGSLTIHPKNGSPQTFYRGDFFILPKGFIGTWESKAAGTLRVLKVIQR